MSGADQMGTGRPHVVALCGSRRNGSYTHRALEEVLNAVQEAGGSGELIALAELDLPPLDPDYPMDGDGERLARRIRNADAIVLGTPMYHGSYSGVLKNALDYCGFDEFETKTVGLLVVSGGPFPTPALNHLRAVCRSLNVWVLPHQVAIPQAQSVFDEDRITDEALQKRVAKLGTQIVQFAYLEKTGPQIDVLRCSEARS